MAELLGWIFFVLGMICTCVACWRLIRESYKIDPKKQGFERKNEHCSRMIKDPVFIISFSIAFIFPTLSLWLVV